MGDLSDIQTGHVVGVCLGGAYVPKTAILLCVSRATVPKVYYSTYKSWEDAIS